MVLFSGSRITAEPHYVVNVTLAFILHVLRLVTQKITYGDMYCRTHILDTIPTRNYEWFVEDNSRGNFAYEGWVFFFVCRVSCVVCVGVGAMNAPLVFHLHG